MTIARQPAHRCRDAASYRPHLKYEIVRMGCRFVESGTRADLGAEASGKMPIPQGSLFWEAVFSYL